MMQVNSISDQNHKREMDRDEVGEGCKMAICYLTLRLPKWSGSHAVPSHVITIHNALTCIHGRLCVEEISSTTSDIMHSN